MIRFAEMVEGLATFRREFPGEVWLELLLQWVTEAPSQVARLVELVGRIAPARVQLNNVARPPAELFAKAVPGARLHAIGSLFPGRVEVIVDRDEPEPEPGLEGDPDGILVLLRRRLCSADGIADGLGVHRTKVLERLDRLMAAGRVRRVVSNDQVFWMASEQAETEGGRGR